MLNNNEIHQWQNNIIWHIQYTYVSLLLNIVVVALVKLHLGATATLVVIEISRHIKMGISNLYDIYQFVYSVLIH